MAAPRLAGDDESAIAALEVAASSTETPAGATTMGTGVASEERASPAAVTMR